MGDEENGPMTFRPKIDEDENGPMSFMQKLTVAKANAVSSAKSVTDSVSDWGKNVGSQVGGALSDAGTALADKATGAGNDIKNAFNDAKGLVGKQTISNKKTLTKWEVKQDEILEALFPIGRPCKFNQAIDQYHRFGNYLRSKMSVIDLLPVDYGIEYKRMIEMLKADNEGQFTSIYNFGYGKDNGLLKSNITIFKNICEYHGLKPYTGIRLFTTDDTTTSETIQVQYKDNTFQGFADKLTEGAAPYRDFASSIMGSKSKSFMTNVSNTAIKTAKELTDKSGAKGKLADFIGGAIGVATDMVMEGNRMTFPKIWQNTTYHNNLSANIRLVSPYGHPKAIKEFIMKPLSYLILLAAPRTKDGLTYGGSIPVTIKAYGLNYTVLGSIASITVRRGGSDTSYNLFRQPLTVDVSIEFQTLFDAFAVFDPSRQKGAMHNDRGVFSENKSLDNPTSLNLYEGSKDSLLTSLGTILSSLRPVKVVGMDERVDPQVYGMFDAPDRSQIPGAPAFTPIMGNLGSTITNAVSTIGKYASMVTNAPKLIQQGLSNVVYNTAKGSVGTIASTASSWISKPAGIADGITSKIKGLFG